VDFDDVELDDADNAEASLEPAPHSTPAEQLDPQEDDLELLDFSVALDSKADDVAVVDFDDLELDDSASPLGIEDFSTDAANLGQELEPQAESKIDNDLELLTANASAESELPMNSEFDALVAEITPQTDQAGQFAKDDFEEFMPTLTEDDGTTPFNIDFLVEEKY
jgi:hypothetical protein